MRHENVMNADSNAGEDETDERADRKKALANERRT